jgi:hypothetical protein
LFAQEWNPRYEIGQVISWGWMGPVAVEGGTTVHLPDFEISLLGFGQVGPDPYVAVSAEAISDANPIVFEWTAYPQAVVYWVDLSFGEELEAVWQSDLLEGTSVPFDGTLDDGSHVQPGEYWWGVGVQQELGAYTVTKYGYQQRLAVEP